MACLILAILAVSVAAWRGSEPRYPFLGNASPFSIAIIKDGKEEFVTYTYSHADTPKRVEESVRSFLRLAPGTEPKSRPVPRGTELSSRGLQVRVFDTGSRMWPSIVSIRRSPTMIDRLRVWLFNRGR